MTGSDESMMPESDAVYLVLMGITFGFATGGIFTAGFFVLTIAAIGLPSFLIVGVANLAGLLLLAVVYAFTKTPQLIGRVARRLAGESA